MLMSPHHVADLHLVTTTTLDICGEAPLPVQTMLEFLRDPSSPTEVTTFGIVNTAHLDGLSVLRQTPRLSLWCSTQPSSPRNCCRARLLESRSTESRCEAGRFQGTRTSFTSGNGSSAR